MQFFMLLLLLFQNPKNPQPEVRIPALEQRIHELINAERKTTGRQELQWDDKLGEVARAHSEDMARRGYFKHITPEGQGPMKRLEAAGYPPCRLVGENIYQNNLYSRVTVEKRRKTYDWNSMEEIASSTLRGWMESTDHRQNILNSEYTREGIGVAIARDDKVYITEVLCAPAATN